MLHDLPTGAMDRLDEFLQRAKEAGMRFEQAFPRDCVPIERGEVVGEIGGYVSGHR